MIAYPPYAYAGEDDLDERSEPDLLAGLRNGKWLDAQTFPPLTYAVPGVIPEGFTLLVGPPKIGKSWFVLACAIAVAAGGRALGVVPVEARPVLYLALEDGHRRLQDRCRTLLGPEPIPEALDYLTTVDHGQALHTVAAWLDRHSGAAPLVILDTLGKVMPPALQGESAYGRDYRIGTAVKRLADDHPGASFIVNHHDRKAGSDDFVDSVSGTNGLAGSADTVVVLTRARHETSGLLKVTGRDVAEGEYAVSFDAGAAWRIDGGSLADAARRATEARAVAGLGDRMAEIVAYVSENPGGVRAADVADELDLDPKAAADYLVRAHKAARIGKPERGLYAPIPPVESVESVETESAGIRHFDTFDTPTGCAVCALPLDPKLDDGATTHANCEPEGDHR